MKIYKQCEDSKSEDKWWDIDKVRGDYYTKIAMKKIIEEQSES